MTSKQIKNGTIQRGDLSADAAKPSARSAHVGDAITIGDGVANFTTVASVTGLAAGDCFLLGKAQVEPNPLAGSDTAQVICGLFVNGSEVDRSRTQIGENAAVASALRTTIPTQNTVAVPANGTVDLRCSKGGAGIAIEAQQRSLTAIAVDL